MYSNGTSDWTRFFDAAIKKINSNILPKLGKLGKIDRQKKCV